MSSALDKNGGTYMVQKHFSSKISEYRQNKGLTQEELAGRVGVTPQAISKCYYSQPIVAKSK